MGLFGLWLVLVGSSCISAEVATPTLPTLRADLLRAQELVRLTGKARQALTLPELLDALRGLDLIKLHVFNTSLRCKLPGHFCPMPSVQGSPGKPKAA